MNQSEYERIYGVDPPLEVTIACHYGMCVNHGIPHTVVIDWPGQEVYCIACGSRMFSK